MSYLSMMEARLPPGFRFHPRDEELVCDYLEKKILTGNSGTLNGCPTVIDVDLNKCEPWDLPEVACVGGKEWYFFSLRDRKYATGQRTNRATVSGYWKATGKDRQITRKGQLVGMRKTLVFYEGRAPKGRKTDWVMHEFRREACDDISSFSIKEDWVLCRVFYKSRGHSSSKPSMDTSYEDKTSCSSLPTLMETYINFGPQKSALGLEGYEQVPCFSNFHPNSTRAPMMGPTANSSSRPVKSPTHLGYLPDLGSGLGQLNQLDCDKEVIRAVINHLTKLEGDQKSSDPPSSLGEGSIDSYLCENGLSPIW